MNKGELIERVSGRLGDQQASTAALDALVTEIENAVSAGDKVNISGFGVFERRERAARTSRNPRTGEPIQVKQTSVPVFRPGQTFKTLVAGEGKGQSGRPNGRAQSKAQPAAKTQPAARAQTTARASQGKAQKAQPTAKGRQAKAQQSKAQTSRAQSSYAQPGRARSSYAQPTRAQSSYARTGATAKRQTARAR